MEENRRARRESLGSSYVLGVDVLVKNFDTKTADVLEFSDEEDFTPAMNVIIVTLDSTRSLCFVEPHMSYYEGPLYDWIQDQVSKYNLRLKEGGDPGYEEYFAQNYEQPHDYHEDCRLFTLFNTFSDHGYDVGECLLAGAEIVTNDLAAYYGDYDDNADITQHPDFAAIQNFVQIARSLDETNKVWRRMFGYDLLSQYWARVAPTFSS